VLPQIVWKVKTFVLNQLYHICALSGASSGFGEAIAWRLAEAGCKLIITARRLDRLQQLQQQLVAKYQVGSSHCSAASAATS
jgi:NADP-dependent 3-hydroxy acid dehydrogenase YdfG